MTTASVTAYSFVSTLPKDAGGVNFTTIVRGEASVTPFTLWKGIGASPGETNYLFSHGAIGTHTGLSKIGSVDPGIVLGGVYLGDANAATSALTPSDGGGIAVPDHGKMQIIRSTRWGELAVGGIAKTPSMITGSQVSLASGVLYGINVAGKGVTAGDTVQLEDADAAKFTHVFATANENAFYPFDNGGMWFATSLVVVRTLTGGTASMTLLFNESPSLT